MPFRDEVVRGQIVGQLRASDVFLVGRASSSLHERLVFPLVAG